MSSKVLEASVVVIAVCMIADLVWDVLSWLLAVLVTLAT